MGKAHGTATTSIAARRDAKDIPSNMHGVAYDAQILFIATELGEPLQMVNMPQQQ